MCIYILLISREPEILHDKRFSYQANPRFDMILKIILYFYIFIVINFFLRTNKRRSVLITKQVRDLTWYAILILKKLYNFFIFLFREN